MSNESDIRYAEDRAKKITEALYRVTDLFSDREPLKWSLRSNALEILESVLMFKSSALKDPGGVLKQTEAKVAKLLSLLDLAEAGSFISSLNFDVLKSEYHDLHEFLISPSYGAANFLPAFFEKEEKNIEAPPEEKEKKEVIPESKPLLDKPSREQQRENDDSSIRHSIGQQYGYAQEEERRAVILEYLKQQPGNWVSIGDLVAIFRHDLSEKTLQRDLARLVRDGVLDKQGDRRWRRYALKKGEKG